MFFISVNSEAEVLLKKWEAEGVLSENISQAVIEYQRKIDGTDSYEDNVDDRGPVAEVKPETSFDSEKITALINSTVNEAIRGVVNRVIEMEDDINSFRDTFDTSEKRFRSLRNTISEVSTEVTSMRKMFNELNSGGRRTGFITDSDYIENDQDGETIEEISEAPKKTISKGAMAFLGGL